MVKRKKHDDACGSPLVIEYEARASGVSCPTLRKGKRLLFESSSPNGTNHSVTVAAAEEIQLLDLGSIQMELERALTGIVERLVCLSHESKGKDAPAEILRLSQSTTSHAQSPDPSLVVKANPDKPLTLIISQRNRSAQAQSNNAPPQKVLPPPLESSLAGGRGRIPTGSMYCRRTSRVSVCVLFLFSHSSM